MAESVEKYPICKKADANLVLQSPSLEDFMQVKDGLEKYSEELCAATNMYGRIKPKSETVYQKAEADAAEYRDLYDKGKLRFGLVEYAKVDVLGQEGNEYRWRDFALAKVLPRKFYSQMFSSMHCSNDIRSAWS